MNTLGNRIRLARHENGYTQSHLAELMKVSVATINRWEHDKTVPSSDDLIKLVKILDTDFTTENDDDSEIDTINLQDLQLEELRLELAASRASKKKLFRIMIFTIIIVVVILSSIFLSIVLSMQKFDPNKDDYPIKIVEYYYEEGGE